MVANSDCHLVEYEILVAHRNRFELAQRWLAQAIVGARKAAQAITAPEWRYVAAAYHAVGWSRVRWAASTDFGYGIGAFPSRDSAPRLDGFRAFSGSFGLVLAAYCLRFHRASSATNCLPQNDVARLAVKLAGLSDEAAVGVHAVVEAMAVLPRLGAQEWTDPDALLELLLGRG